MGRITIALIVSSWVIPIAILVNRIVPDPYMDEIFHVPQAQQYCKGNFRSWDPMITTPPGLYFVSLAHVASLFPGISLVNAASSFSNTCSTSILRFSNGTLAVICSILVYDIITHLRPALSDRKATLYALVLALYPLHWFFTFLYYTDVASLTAVLATYLTCLKRKYWISALFGAVAVLIRQTNIIWVLFIICSEVIKLALAHQKDGLHSENYGSLEVKDVRSASTIGMTNGSNLRRRRSNARNQLVAPSTVHWISSSEGLHKEVQDMILMSWQLKWELLSSFCPFLFVLSAFVAFVYWNGSIVLGAKDAHKVSPHFAQLLYFGLVSAMFMAPLHFSLGQATALAQLFWKKKLLSFFQWIITLTIGFLSVHFFRYVHPTLAQIFVKVYCKERFSESSVLLIAFVTRCRFLSLIDYCSIAHPYLLADNRHYPFYLWRKVIKSHWIVKYLLVPLYAYSWFSILNLLGKTQKKIWVVAFFLASAAALIPAPLIEFRYYTIPLFFLILHTHVDDKLSWLLMGLIYVAINFFTMYMFLCRPFSWDHEPGIQRFIW